MSDTAATLRRASVLTTVVGTFVLASSAGAQNATTKPAAAPADEEKLVEVVVTGSRVRRDEFTSSSPVQIITRDQSVLAGLANTTEILQGSTATGGGQQINNYFGGFVTEGGPGANTISLRGLGAVRTLVLLNGRRLAPAGTRGQVGSADLNVLPSAMVERIEILKDGASSIYGSDAVAGVVNIITRRGIDEWTVEATGLNTYDGGGDQTVASLVGGQTSDRFEINGSLEYYERTNLEVGQRDWAKCSTEYLRDPDTGERLDMMDPLTGKPQCFPISGLAGTNGTAHNYMVSSVPGRGARWEPDPGATSSLIPGWKNVDVAANRAPFNPMLLKESLISPARAYTGFLNATYDLRALGDGELYFELLGTRRESEQIGSRQLSLDYNRGNPLVPEPFRTSGGGLGVNPFGQTLAARALVAWGNDETSQKVDFWRGVVGVRGNLGFLDNWKYDVYAMASKSKADYTFQSFLTDRIYNSVDVVVAPTGTTAPTRSVNGVTYTCRVNTTNPGAGCVPAPAITGSFLRGIVDDAYRSYVFRPVTGNTSFDETLISAVFDGSIYPLPAGDIKGALGLEYRTDKLNDTPSLDSINANLYNLTSGGITKGKDTVKEVFAEVEVPILRGAKFAEDLTVNLSGRYTDYDSYGSDETYKMALSYTPVKWLKLRGTKGTSFRAPGIYEQYLSPTSGFLSAQNDPCNQYGNLPTTSIRYRNCASELPGQPNFLASNSVRVDAAGGRATGLKSEGSTAETIGIVLQPDFSSTVGDLSFAVDWWKIDVTDQIDRIGGAALLRLCYDDPQFRAGGSYCSFVDPRASGGSLRVLDNFINVANQIAEGLDYTVRYVKDIGTGRLKTDVRATQYRVQDSKLLPTDSFDKNNGTLFSPEWVGDIDVRYEWKEWTLRYGLTYVGKMDSYAFFEEDPATSVFDLNTGAYVAHNVSLKYKSKNKWEVLAGVRNLTDTQPEKFSAGVTSLRQGDALLYSGYDFFGRTLFMTVSKTF